MFISSSQALDLLQEYAPRAWCKRLLQWQILDRALHLYFTSGQITQKRQAGYYLLDMFQDLESARPSLPLVGKHFGKEIEDKLRAAGCPEEPEVKDCFGLNAWVDLETDYWTNEPRSFPVGVLMFAEELDCSTEVKSLRAVERLKPQRPDVGRPRKWDWEGALTAVIQVANTPDGLPEGYGAQAIIERAIADWFATTAGSSPPESEIRKRAAEIVRATRRK